MIFGSRPYRKRKERLGKVRFEAITHKRMTNEIICSVVASEDFNFGLEPRRQDSLCDLG